MLKNHQFRLVVLSIFFMEYTAAAVPDIFAARSTKYKCYKDNEGNYFAYDLEKDPGELKKILPDNFSEEVKKLKEYLDSIMLN